MPYVLNVAESHVFITDSYRDTIPAAILSYRSTVENRTQSDTCIHLRRPYIQQGVEWEVNQNHLEAVLGLWAWSITSDPELESRHDSELRMSAYDVRSTRIMATGATKIEIDRAEADLKLWNQRVKGIEGPIRSGIGGSTAQLAAMKKPKSAFYLDSKQFLRFYGWQIVPVDLQSTDMHVLTTTLDQPIPTLCAHEVYQSFLCAFVGLFDTIEGNSVPAMGRRGLYFTNEVVTSLVECFVASALGSAQDAYSLIIPALLRHNKLPLLKDVVPSLHSAAEKHRKQGKQREAEDILKTAWKVALEVHDGKDSTVLNACMLELGELYRHAIFGTERSEVDFGRRGILGLNDILGSRNNRYWVHPDSSWTQEDTERFFPSVAVKAARYAEIQRRAASQPQPSPESADVIKAISRGDRTESLWLMSHIWELSVVGETGRTVISWAAQRGWREIVKAALDVGWATDLKDSHKRTPLSYAAEEGHADVVEILLANGALLTNQDKGGRTPVSYAVAGDSVPVLDILLRDHRATVFAPDNSGRTPLHWAAKRGQKGVLDRLLRNAPGDALDASDKQGLTPLLDALLEGQTATARFLADRGASPDVLIWGLGAWGWTIHKARWDCAAFLLWLTNRKTNEAEGKLSLVLKVFEGVERSWDSGSESNQAPPPSDDGPDNEIRIYFYDERGNCRPLTVDIIAEVTAGAHSAVARLCRRGETIIDIATPQSLDHAVGLLLDQLGGDAEATQKVFEVAAAMGTLVVMKMFLNGRGASVTVTDAVVRGAAANEVSRGVLELLLDKRGGEFVITDEVVRAAAGNGHFGKGVVALLLKRRGAEVEITDGVLLAAARNESLGGWIMEVILRARGAKVEVTEELLVAAAGNERVGGELMEMLLKKGGAGTRITDGVVLAAEANVGCGDEVVKLLVKKRGGKVTPT